MLTASEVGNSLTRVGSCESGQDLPVELLFEPHRSTLNSQERQNGAANVLTHASELASVIAV
jgi:hypothetical protein